MEAERSVSGNVPWPTRLADLDEGERLVLWSFRRWVAGTEHWPLVWNEFARQFGAREGRLALRGFARLIDAMRGHARRTIVYHQPCCPCLGADEVCVVSLVAAAQAGDLALARAIAGWLVRSPGIERMVEQAHELGHAMRGRGMVLAPRCARAPTPTLH